MAGRALFFACQEVNSTNSADHQLFAALVDKARGDAEALNWCNEYGYTATYVASQRGDTEMLRALVDAGADLNQVDHNGATPAYIAAHNGKTQALQLLMEGGADINKADDNKETPLWIAACNGKVESLLLLIHSSNNINSANESGVTPAWIAAQQDESQALELLIDSNADLSLQSNGMTPLDVAKKHGNAACVELLQQVQAIAEEQSAPPTIVESSTTKSNDPYGSNYDDSKQISYSHDNY